MDLAASIDDVLARCGVADEARGTRRVLQCQFVVSEHARPEAQRPELPERFSEVARYFLEGGGR